METDQDGTLRIKTEYDSLTIESYAESTESSNMDSSDTKPLRTGVSIEVVYVELRCLNCGSDLSQKRRHKVTRANVEVIAVIRRWIAPQLIEEDDHICHSCFMITLNERYIEASQEVNGRESNGMSSGTSNGRHRQLCLTCQCSILRKRSHLLNTSNEREMGIRNVVIKEIAPRQLKETDQICHPCWQKRDRKLKVIETPPPPSPCLPPPPAHKSVIYLPNLMRSPATQRYCFYPNCKSKNRISIPRWLRIKLFTQHNFYVPFNCRLCNEHLTNQDWTILKSHPNATHMFTSDHIEDFASFVKERHSIIDFNNIDVMEDETVKYWTGLTKHQFTNVFAKLPLLGKSRKNCQIGLAAYLMKLKTGDPVVKIANLLNIPRTTLMRVIHWARNVLQNLPDDAVPSEIANDVNNDDGDENDDENGDENDDENGDKNDDEP